MNSNTNVIVSHKEDNDNGELNTKRTSVKQNIFNGHNEQKCLLYSRSVEKHEQTLDNYNMKETIVEDVNVIVVVHLVTKVNTLVNYDYMFLKQWPGISPTVNISWFIAKAYLANLYYTSQCDVNLTLKTCDDIIDVYRQSNLNLLIFLVNKRAYSTPT